MKFSHHRHSLFGIERLWRLRLGWFALLVLPGSMFAQTISGRVAASGASQNSTSTALQSRPAGSSIDSSALEIPSHQVSSPGAIAMDASGNVYAAVGDGVFRIDRAGMGQRIAGLERKWRFSGDGIPAAAAGVNPKAIALDAAGNIYIADAGNHRIRKLSPNGVITTVAGNGTRGFAGDGGPAVAAQLDAPTGVALDAAGNIYFADGTLDGHHRIRKILAATGIISTIAGNGEQGYSGDDGPATLARFHMLGGIAVDPQGNIYVADSFNNRVRMISQVTGFVTTVAGNGNAGRSGDGGAAAEAELNHPLDVAIDPSGDLFIADAGNYRIRTVNLSTGIIASIGQANAYLDPQRGYPCSLVFDSAGNLYVADFGSSRIREIPAAIAKQPVLEEAVALRLERSFASGSGFQINVTYGGSVPAAAQTAFNSVVSEYEGIFTSNVTVNLIVNFGNTGLGESDNSGQNVSYTAWRSAMIANANNNPGNTNNVSAAASLPAGDPIGNGTIFLTTANARALGITANTSVDSTLTFSNSVTFEYTGVSTSGAADFLDTAAHELDEALGIGSALTGLADNAHVPSGDYAAEDYFRYSAQGVRAITTNPTAFVYFSFDGGATQVAQFNQAFSAEGDTDLDRNDWVYGNSGCPASPAYVQDAISCIGQAVPIGTAPETTVLHSLGYDSSLSQTITFNALGNVVLGVAPFSLSATASSGLPVSFASITMPVCTVSGSAVTVIAIGTCSITASQAGNATYAAAPSVTRSFSVTSPGTCAATFLPTSASWPAAGGSSTVAVTDGAGCAWTASSNASWITITSGSNGTGNGTVGYSVAANGGSARSGSITIAALTFNVTQSAPAAQLHFVPITPCRIADTRNANGPFGGPSIAGNTSRDFAIPASACNIPANAAAFSLNLTVVPLGPLGFVSIWPSGQPQPGVSTLNSSDGRVKANAAIVPAGVNGAVTIFASNATHVIVDINGYFIADPGNTALAFYPLTPCRIADTRNPTGTLGGPSLIANQARDFPVTTGPCAIPANAQAYALNLTVVPHQPLGFLSAWPTGSPQPGASTLNAPTGTVVANAAIIPAGTGGSIRLIATDATDVIIDINGYFAPPGGAGALSFYPLNPCRIMDTRNANGTFGGPILAANTSRNIPIESSACGVPSTVKAYSLNATVVPPAPLGFLQLWNTGGAQPGVSTLNASDASLVANAAIVPAGTAGSVTAFASNATHLILDINGYFAP